MHPSHTKIEPTVLIGPLCSDLPEKVRIDPRRISCRCIYILESFCFRFGSETNCLPHLLVYFCCVRDGTQRLLTQRIMTQTHTHVQGYSDRPGQAHLEKPLHGFIRCGLWCDRHSFEMPHVALIKITNKKYTTHPARHRMTVFIVVLGGFLFPWFSLTIQPLNGIEMSLKENTNFNWY